jgi:hypothetical protein
LNYKELFEKHKLFKEWDDKWYDLSREKTNWQNLQELTVERMKNEVIWFLNKWGCRIGPERICDVVAKGIKGRCMEATPFLKALDRETLEGVDFDKTKKVIFRELSNSRIIYHIFSTFCDIRHSFRWTATSKVLHMINSKLFVMWDEDIRDGYSLEPSASSYAYQFMPRMKQEINEVISTYMKDQNSDRTAAIKEIMSACDGKTLAKIVDEYNWIKYTKKLDC